MRKRLVGLVPLVAAYVLTLALGAPLWVAVVVLAALTGVYWRFTWPPGFRARMLEAWRRAKANKPNG
jgi:hypothetical protein